MSLPLLLLSGIVFLAVAYRLYGRWIAARIPADDARATPAVSMEDGQDYVPTRPFYLLGQHFSAIAAAGPIVGPIAACQQFGWLPCFLWIVLGAVFIGAVHDFSALLSSVRHRARSVAEIVRENLSPRAGVCMILFIWIALVYVIVAFTQVTAGTFLGKVEELDGVEVPFHKGGAVAFASTTYLLLAIVLGVVQRFLKPPLWLATLLFVPATIGVVWLGTQNSLLLALTGPEAQRTWGLILLLYCFVASLIPVSVLLQPRGYLGGFVLYLALFVGVVGVLFGGFSVRQPAVAENVLNVGGEMGSLFPFLFVTIACGACSGFHGLVCSGTTSKQIARESHCRPVGYGGMLLEAFVALIALAAVMISALPAGTPGGAVYGDGMGSFLSVLIGGEHRRFAVVFGTMIFSTFVFDTLDVATRLGRYLLQELFGARGRAAAVVATLLTVGVPAAFVLLSPADGWRKFWTLFGASNQLFAALTLLGVTVWLVRSGRRFWFTLAPMLFVLTITVWALVRIVWAGFFSGTGAGSDVMMKVNASVALTLLVLTGLIVGEAVRAVRRGA